MKAAAILLSTLVFAQTTFAGGFFADMDETLANRGLCEASVDQEIAERTFKLMYSTLKLAATQKLPSNVEVLDFGGSSTTLVNRQVQALCTLTLQGLEGSCYTVSCIDGY
jgi:hypothetical protein